MRCIFVVVKNGRVALKPGMGVVRGAWYGFCIRGEGGGAGYWMKCRDMRYYYIVFG